MAKYPVSGGDYKLPPPGAHLAICYVVADLGLQDSGAYGAKRKLAFRFELPNERNIYTKDGHEVNAPMSVGAMQNASMSKKSNLRPMLEGWRGKVFTDEEAADFDVRSVLGKPCMLSIIHETRNGNTYANINAVMPVPKGTPQLHPENPLVYYGPEDKTQLAKLPKSLQDRIAKALPEPTVQEPTDGLPPFEDDEIPF